MPSGGVPSWPFAPSGGVPSGFSGEVSPPDVAGASPSGSSGGVSVEVSEDAGTDSVPSAAAVLVQAASESSIAAASRIGISFFMENSLLVLVLWLYSIAGI